MRTTPIAITAALLVTLAPSARADDERIGVVVRNPSELTTGVVTATIGGASLVAGSSFLVAWGVMSGCSFCSNDAKVYGAIGAPLAITGGIAAIVGVFLALHGGEHVQRWALAPASFAVTF